MPSEVLRNLAAALMVDDETVVDGVDPVAAERLPALRAQAPALYARFGAHLEAEPPAPRPKPKAARGGRPGREDAAPVAQGEHRHLGVVLIIAIALLRWAVMCPGQS